MLADVQDGLGPFLAIYLLSSQHWQPGRIGIVMTISGFATVLARPPVGSLIDRITWKRELIVVAAAIIGVSVMVMALVPQFWPVAIFQGITGAANSVFPPALAAITLGIVGQKAFTRRIGRNESFNHGGNAFTAIAAGLTGYLIAQVAVLWVIAALAGASIVAALRLHGDDIDNELASGRTEGNSNADAASGGLWALLRNRNLLIFSACITLFHFANAAMLPILGEKLSRGDPRFSSLFISACIITAQIVMVPVAALVGRKADAWGRKPLFLVGFAALPIRGVLYTLVDSPYLSVAIQILDGIGAGTFFVLFFIVVEDLTRGTGRYNLAQGVTSAAWGFGAALSNTVAGYIVQLAGFDAAFLFLAACAGAAFLLFLFAMPETGTRETATPPADDTTSVQAPA
ncbi:MAG: MFS transporter [Pseudomonadota bacterium]|nr:MFS transporter [Pseudomonadota bacterium]